MHKIYIFISILLVGSQSLAKENIFTMRNTTASKLEVKLRLGSETKKYTLNPLEKKSITESGRTCLNRVEALAVNKKLVGKKAKFEDVKGCSGKTIIFVEKDDELKIEGLTENTSAELGKKTGTDVSDDSKIPTDKKNSSDSKSKDDSSKKGSETTDSTSKDEESLDIEEMIKTYK